MEIVQPKSRRINKRNNPQLEPLSADDKARIQKYDRSQPVPLRRVQDKKLKSALKRKRSHAQESAMEAARTELLMTEENGYIETEGMEKTFLITQEKMKEELPIQAARKAFNLDLDEYGPYSIDNTRNGRYMVIGGERGHVALIDRLSSKLRCEVLVGESVRDVQFLHNYSMFAVAQKKYTYIYDARGTELHCMRKHIDVHQLDFLPFHFLLASVGGAGFLKYQDVATGQLVAEHRTGLGPCRTMRQNPRNAVMHLGHGNGTVTLWTPNMTSPAAQVFAGPGAVQALAVDTAGQYMATALVDGTVKIWDLRTYKELYRHFMPGRPVSVDISQRGVLAVGFGTHAKLFAGPLSTPSREPYLHHCTRGSPIKALRFAPYDDVLCIGHRDGATGMLVPGAGEANFDSFVASPFENNKQMAEREVQQLLDKVQPEMISLHDVFGKVKKYSDNGALDTSGQATNKSKRRRTQDIVDDEELLSSSSEESDEEETNGKKRKKEKRKMRGKNKPTQRMKKKDNVFVDPKREKKREENEIRKEAARERKKQQQQQLKSSEAAPVLDRFKKKNKK